MIALNSIAERSIRQARPARCTGASGAGEKPVEPDSDGSQGITNL
jgi:hypothetical protein